MNKTCDTKPIFFTMIEDRFVYSVQKMFYLLFYHTFFPSLRFDFIASIFAYFSGKEAIFNLEEVLNFLKENPDIRNKLSGKMRNISLVSDANLKGDGANK